MDIVFTILIWVAITIQAIVALYMLIPSLLLLSHGIGYKGEKLLAKKYPIKKNKSFDFAAIVTAHQDIRFIAPLVDSFCRQTYGNFVLYVVADDCDVSSLNFADSRVKILRPEKALHAKIQSIKYAVDRFEREHEVMVIFDSDNLVRPDYLEKLNSYYERGFRAVQTHMLSKNTDTVYARLDSIGHIYNTFVERQGKMDRKLSSSILGLGISLETSLYRQVMYKDALGGFDKKLQADIVKTIPQLAFAADAIVYDEKVDDGNALEKQRTRWIYTYFKYFPINWSLFKTGIQKGNFNLLFFGFTALRPPLFIMLGMAFIFLLLGIIFHPLMAWAWAAILLIYILSFVLIVLTQSRQKGMGSALLYIPVMVLRQISALLKIKRATKNFLKTEHIQVVYIEDLLKNENL